MKVSGNYTSVCMHNQPKNVGQKPNCSKRKGPSHDRKPNIDSYVDPFLYYSTQSSSPSEPHGSATSQTASVSSTSQLSTTPSCIYPTTIIFTTTTSVPSSQLAVMSQPTGSSVNMNTMIAAAIAQLIQPTLTHQIGKFNFNSSSQLPLNTSQTQPSTSVSTVTSNCPFEIKFLTPAIKICAGCRKGYARASDGKNFLPPPNGFCLFIRNNIYIIMYQMACNNCHH